MDEEDRIDIIVHGCTGYTGTLIANYLAKTQSYYSWGLGGRDGKKLNDLKQELIKSYGNHLSSIPLFVADSSEYYTLLQMTKKCRVVIACAGPFIKYGEEIARACVHSGTHYLDITGEPSYIRKLIDQYDEAARERNVVLIPASGFDSVPADLGVYFVEKNSKSGTLDRAEAFLSTSGGAGMSYGTYSTIIESLSGHSSSSSSSSKKHKTTVKPKNIQKLLPHKSPHTNSVVFPFNFTSDPFVVTRSRRLIGKENFSYAQYMEMDGYMSAYTLLIGMIFFFIVLRFIPFGASILRSLKTPGSGPSETLRKNAATVMKIYGKDTSGEEVSAIFTGPEGYTATAVFAAEAALCIVDQIRHQRSLPYGVSTPSLLGEDYLQRLNRTSCKFTLNK